MFVRIKKAFTSFPTYVILKEVMVEKKYIKVNLKYS